MTTRSLAQAAHERFTALVMRTHLDFCANTFGVAPCTATGEPCYNTYGTCKDKPHYVKTEKVRDYCLRGMSIPPGETLRPYIVSYSFSPTELPIGGGLAVRSNVSITLTDEACSDAGEDPYYATRATPAGGSYQTRLLARNYNYSGRQVEMLKGYVTDPFNWDTFQTELYVFDKIAGPDGSGNINYTLSDVIKPLDKNLLPQPTNGTLQADFKAIEYTGAVVAADLTHITLQPDASVVDNAYAEMEFYISQNTGYGQRVVCSSYVGETRVATVSALSVAPDTTSVVEVSALNINVGSGLGAQYHDPAVTGEPEYICIGKEQIRYTAITGDVLSWPDATYRAQWGTAKEDHAVDDGVSQVLAFVDKSFTYVAQYLLNASGIADAHIDLVGLAQEDADWLGGAVHITASIAFKPEKASGLLNEFLKDMNVMSWWDPVAQQQKFKCDMPSLPGTNKSITPSETIGKSMQVTTLDDKRITQSVICYAPYSATGQMTDRSNFKVTDGYEDANAESANEYNNVVQSLRYSRWLTESNALHARALVARQISRFRDAPWQAEFDLDPKDEVGMADLLDVSTRKKTDATGAPLVVEMRVIRLLDEGNFKVKAVSNNFQGRGAFIAPDGTPDYPTDTTYAHISDASGLMSDGTDGYTIL